MSFSPKLNPKIILKLFPQSGNPNPFHFRLFSSPSAHPKSQITFSRRSSRTSPSHRSVRSCDPEILTQSSSVLTDLTQSPILRSRYPHPPSHPVPNPKILTQSPIDSWRSHRSAIPFGSWRSSPRVPHRPHLEFLIAKVSLFSPIVSHGSFLR